MIGFALLAILALFSPFVDAAKQLDYIVPEANAPLGEGLDHANLRTIELVSAPIKLRYGEVFNTWLPPIHLPEDVVKDYANRSMQIVDYRMSITDADGAPVPLYNTYNHHYAIVIGKEDAMNDFFVYVKDDPYGANATDSDNSTGMSDMSPSQKMMGGMAASMMAASMVDETPKIATFGGGSGAEERGTSHLVPKPYAWLVDSPEATTQLAHFINTRDPSRTAPPATSPLLECPCTPQRVWSEGPDGQVTVDGHNAVPAFYTCSDELYVEEKNPSCSPDTYVSGFRCCEDGVFLYDTESVDVEALPVDEVYARISITFVDDAAGEDATAEESLPLRTPSCCDATGNGTYKGNVEFDVIECPEGTPPEECIMIVETVQPIDGAFDGGVFGGQDEVEQGRKQNNETGVVALPYAVGHLHTGGIDISLYDNVTDELVCRSEAIYGNGTEAGNEDKYLVGMTPCVFKDPPQFDVDHPMRIVARYNATQTRRGVMALWLMQVADVKPLMWPPLPHNNTIPLVKDDVETRELEEVVAEP